MFKNNKFFHLFLQKYIRNVQQFAQLKVEDKRSILKFLKEDQIDDVIKVVSTMPLIDFQVRCEGKLNCMCAIM